MLRGHTLTVRCLEVLDGKQIAVSGSRDSILRDFFIYAVSCDGNRLDGARVVGEHGRLPCALP